MREFKAESKKLLDLVINSIYANDEVFLRELVSNASDALDKARLGNASAQGWQPTIEIAFDQAARTLSVTDNGIGMSEEQLAECLGTIAHSNSQQVKRQLAGRKASVAANDANDGAAAADVDIIGQFGVGFYSAFMVADRVRVTSRAAGASANEAHVWESDGASGFTIKPAQREQAGTTVELHIRPSTAERNFERFLDQSTLISLVRTYSNYVRYPIVMTLVDEHFDDQTGLLVRDEQTRRRETINAQTPLWTRPEDEVGEEDLRAFYRAEFHDAAAPLASLRAKARGAISYDALLFVPAEEPDELWTRDFAYGLRLYSAGVLICDTCEALLPEHLRFVRGIVDMRDANLNLSRESLQDDGRIQIIARQLERRVLDGLRQLQAGDRARYEQFFATHGSGLKYSICAGQGTLNEVLSDLLLFRSARAGKAITLQEYLAAAKPARRQRIYYAAGHDKKRLAESPAVRALLAASRDVLLCDAGAQDEVCLTMLGTFHGAELVSASDADLALDEGLPAEMLDDAARHTLFQLFRHAPCPLVRVTASRVLSAPDQPASRVATQAPLSLSMAKYLYARRQPDQAPQPLFVLEINVRHALYDRARKACEMGDDQGISACATVMLGQALLAEDMLPPNPVAFNAACCALMR